MEFDSISRSPKNGSARSEERLRTDGRSFYFGLMNRFVKSLLRIGLPVGPTTLLTVRGRKSGRPRTTPVGFLEHDGRRYVFGTFGDVDWTRNLRASGEAVVGRGWRRKRVSAVELRSPEEKGAGSQGCSCAFPRIADGLEDASNGVRLDERLYDGRLRQGGHEPSRLRASREIETVVEDQLARA